MQINKIGTLYVVATPIGNLQDITLRAIEILKSVNRIAAEDTRHSTSLLNHFSIKKPTISLHDFNERQRMSEVIELLQAGESIALISDAGTPLISDPGFPLVREAKAAGVPVVPVPGACAAIAALSACGLPADKFVFEGFLSAKAETRRNRLTTLRLETRTIVFYEAPHRLLDALQALSEVFGAERQIVVARELTKMYESILSGTVAELIAYYEAHEKEQRGEVVIIVHGADEISESKEVITEKVLEILLSELPLKQAVSLASKITGERKNVLYDAALQLKDGAE